MKTQINLQLHQNNKKEYLIHKSKSCFLEMINEIEKMAILHKGKRNINN